MEFSNPDFILYASERKRWFHKPGIMKRKHLYLTEESFIKGILIYGDKGSGLDHVLNRMITGVRQHDIRTVILIIGDYKDAMESYMASSIYKGDDVYGFNIETSVVQIPDKVLYHDVLFVGLPAGEDHGWQYSSLRVVFPDAVFISYGLSDIRDEHIKDSILITTSEPERKDRFSTIIEMTFNNEKMPENTRKHAGMFMLSDDNVPYTFAFPVVD